MEENKELNALASAEQLEQIITIPSSQIAKDEKGDERKITNMEKIYIRPFVFRQWLQVTRHLKNILAALPNMDLDFNDPAKLGLYILHVLGEAEADVLGVMSIATRRPIEFFDTIELDDAVKLIRGVFEVNESFFTQKILPMLETELPTLAEKVKSGVGLTQ